ncbi:hypothetical protein [Sphingomonas bacterium]|uniref:hypothetical protein n=1 Tax=Sphingomonas bacterium TaxID=1895847 RepID=UPI001575FA58|nr:hypothetical protein [Sphingomonas bacterium]
MSNDTASATRLMVCGLACIASSRPALAQDIPTDTQVQQAFGRVYNHLGLIEYCAAKGFATAADIANARKTVDATTGGMSVGAAARAQEGDRREKAQKRTFSFLTWIPGLLVS